MASRPIENLAWAVVGAGLGYLLTRHYLEEEFQKRLDGQLENADEYYRLKYEKKLKKSREEDMSTSKEIVEVLRAGVEEVEQAHKDQVELLVDEITAKKPSVLVSDEDLMSTLKNYQGMFKGESEPSEKTETPYAGVYLERSFAEDRGYQPADPPEKPKGNLPVMISQEAFMENHEIDGESYKQVSMTYYAGDNVLASESNQIVSEGVRRDILGDEVLEKLAMGLDGDADVVYVRNKAKTREYEIFRDHRPYTEAVGPIGSVE